MPEIIYTQLPEGVDTAWMTQIVRELPNSWLSHITAFKNPIDQTRTAVGRLLLLRCAVSVYGEKLKTELVYTSGKPSLVHHPHFHFNISHSGQYVALATSGQGPLGIDIEQQREIEPQYFTHLMSADELNHLQQNQFTTSEFFKWWTRKEALSKAAGHGLNMALHSYDIMKLKANVDGNSYSIYTFVLAENLTCSLVYSGIGPVRKVQVHI